MRQALRDSEHLLRLAGVFAAGTLAFLVLRALLVPESFGVYGHYRADAMIDNRLQHPVYAGRAACEDCHTDVADARRGGAHERVGCEACHGPLAAHAADPLEVVPVAPELGALCGRCHERLGARPAGFPQVDAQEHADGAACSDCHEPHAPGFD